MEQNLVVPTTPPIITAAVRRLSKRIARTQEPVYLPVLSEPGAASDNCFSTVAAKISRDGGSAVYGWTIWSTPVLVEGEFHAAWKSPSGELIDISFRPNGEQRTLFLADPSRVYEGRQVDNIRVPVYENDVLVERFIRVSENIFDVMNSGKRANQHGMVSVPAKEIGPLLLRKEKLGLEIIARNVQPNSPCVCGGNRKIKNCCGKAG